ncbi:hypothetical protein FNV43_RR08223 [Rhamnella rubrinervis]|uniref:Uncharacterized protein n=1 Tax=Rhamnella rubrinervis TaxID=2594499 RepID=A0A8K0HGQ0_9ROSA|nr:hypothetical protein FNV43_RR08223 [Rhamnella rubrinervis]
MRLRVYVVRVDVYETQVLGLEIKAQDCVGCNSTGFDLLSLLGFELAGSFVIVGRATRLEEVLWELTSSLQVCGAWIGTINSASQIMLAHKGNVVSIRVNDDAYQKRIALCQIFASLHITNLTIGIGMPLRIDNTTLKGNYSHFAWVLVYVDLVGFFSEKLLLETTDDCIEIDLYFESFLNFCNSCNNVGYSMAKCKSVIGKAPPKVGSYGKEKENKASGLTQVYKPKQAPPLHVESITPFMPTINTFKILNINVTPTSIEELDHQQAAILFYIANTHTEMGINVRSTASDLGATPNRTDLNTNVGKSVQITSKSVQTPLHHSICQDFDGTSYVGQHSNSMAMVPFNSSGSLTAS